ncbi:uncharacterized protein LOC141640528 [Silene latifolia]|uniref:uncharacterized protein LOC141640528 n=1 Tax=Silene latifolia TaxID=37657 RepID=UPI003D77B310
MGARHLSYAGRLVLVKAVFSTLHDYWARIFILPQIIIKKIEAVCRDFLWHGKESKNSPAMVTWEQICRPKKYGGLGLKQLHLWNLASIAKYVWWIESKADHLWVKWGGYTVSQGYSWLQPAVEQVDWAPWIVNNWLVPKHGFISWLAGQNRLLTQDRLLRMKIIQTNSCYLCGQGQEEHSHLFFRCVYSSTCKNLVSAWCKEKLPEQDWCAWWIKRRYRTITKKKIMGLILAALIYHIWAARNTCRVDRFLNRPEVVLQKIKHDVRSRIKNCSFKSHSGSVVVWTDQIMVS